METIKKFVEKSNDCEVIHEVVTYDDKVFYFNSTVCYPNGMTSESGVMFRSRKTAIKSFDSYINSLK